MDRLLLGRFRLEAKLGSGGFGVVYRAWDQRLERDVALKVIAASGKASQRVLREAQATARLSHPGIVTLYEFGEDGRNAYLVSELVEGHTLRELSRDGVLSDHQIGEISLQLCEALDHAHSRGVVHRDIKPQNVLCAENEHEPRAKLMDFGIARVLDEEGITATGDVVGTLAYMSPEQADGQPAEEPTDVYALALTAYECWSGENPHLRATPAATARAISTPVPSLARACPRLPAELCGAVDACLDPEPDRRPTLAELAEEIEDALPELDRGARRRTSSPLGSAQLGTRSPAGIAAAAAIGGLTAAAVLGSGAGSAATYVLAPLCAVLALLRARLGFSVAVIGLGVWFSAVGRPGEALVLVVLALPALLLIEGEGRLLPLPLAAPALGALGLAALYPALASLGRTARERLVLGGLGYAWIALAEAALGRKLLFGPAKLAPAGWQQSVGRAAGLLVSVIAQPSFLFGVALWALAALTLGALIRGRSPVLGLLGALLWAAALLAALHLRAGAEASAPALVAAIAIAFVGAAAIRRIGVFGATARGYPGMPPGARREAGRPATLP